MSRFCSTWLAIILCVGSLVAQAPPNAPNLPKIKVLILTGVNNHNWIATTPALREVLEQTGRFQVRVNEEVRGNGPETFAPYDVLLLNYNDLKHTAGPWWDDRARQAMLDFVRNGKGLVSYHAANNAFWGWDEFDKMVGGTWRETAGHAPYHTYTVKIVDREDPITQGMPASFAETDELYHGLSMQPGIHLLATAYDDPNNCGRNGQGCGTGKDEPLIWTLKYGSGRVFQTALGHDVNSLQGSGIRLTLARGTEWAATGQVTIPVAAFSEGSSLAPAPPKPSQPSGLPAAPPLPKVKVLILTGISNHKWALTTPVLREVLEQTGRFDVRVNEEVRGNGPETFAPYDVLLLNYNDARHTAGPWWDDRAREAMLDFVRNGKGFVCYHHSDNAFWGWDEFDKLVGGTWRETGGHAALHPFTAKIADAENPITQGMPATFAEADELYHGLTLQPNIQILATAYDDPHNCAKNGKNCGTGKDEPLMWTLKYGSGRVFQTTLGHDVQAMDSPGFRLTLVRGTEWAATGQVTIPVPADLH